MERICRIKGLDLKKHNLSFVCYDLSQIAAFTKQLTTSTYKLMKKTLPGPYTFILEANNTIPKLFKNSKKEIGIRIPDNNVAQAILEEIGMPLVVSSVHDEDSILEYTTDPELIEEKHGRHVDAVIQGGFGELYASTIIDCTSGIPEVIREGRGDIESLL